MNVRIWSNFSGGVHRQALVSAAFIYTEETDTEIRPLKQASKTLWQALCKAIDKTSWKGVRETVWHWMTLDLGDLSLVASSCATEQHSAGRSEGRCLKLPCASARALFGECCPGQHTSQTHLACKQLFPPEQVGLSQASPRAGTSSKLRCGMAPAGSRQSRVGAGPTIPPAGLGGSVLQPLFVLPAQTV